MYAFALLPRRLEAIWRCTLRIHSAIDVQYKDIVADAIEVVQVVNRAACRW